MQKKKGVSLIVLVIVIIVMIILAGAVIISLNNSGIMERASDSVKLYNQDEVEHIAQIAWSEAYLNKQDLREGVKKGLINAGLNPQDYGFVVTDKGVNITKGWLQDGLIITKGDQILEAGDLFQYSAGVDDYTGAWKVLGAEDGNLLLMSTEDIASLNLYGLEGDGSTTNYGLLNGIDRLNELCTQYGSGTGAVGARSIKVEDVDKLTGYDKTSYERYGLELTYTWNDTNSGKVDYKNSNGESGMSPVNYSNGFNYLDYNKKKLFTILPNQKGLPTLKIDFYSYTVLTDLTKATEMITGKDSTDKYFLASLTIADYNNIGTDFSIFGIHNGGLKRANLFNSFGTQSNKTLGVRAVVKLSPNIKILTKDNTLGWSYTI